MPALTCISNVVVALNPPPALADPELHVIRVQAALVATGGLGALLFSLGDSVASLALARAIIGIGFAGGLMAAFKAVVIWVPERRRPLANACVMSMGAIGDPMRVINRLPFIESLARGGLLDARGRFQHSALHPFLVGAVGDAKRNVNTAARIVHRPVRQNAFGEEGVGHDDAEIVVGGDHRAANID